MFRNSSILRNNTRLCCAWIPTGNPNQPLACAWLDADTRANRPTASSSNYEMGRSPLCA